jgi:hypothetical protein
MICLRSGSESCTSELIYLLGNIFDRRDWQRVLEEILVRSRVPILGLSQQGEESKEQRRMHLQMVDREKKAKG